MIRTIRCSEVKTKIYKRKCIGDMSPSEELMQAS